MKRHIITAGIVRSLVLGLLIVHFALSWGNFAYCASQPVLDQASDIQTDTSAFDNNLSSADNTVQKALDTLDELIAAGGHDAVTLTTLADKFLSLSTQQIDLQLADPGADRLMAWDEDPTDGFVWIDYSGWDVTAYTAGDFLTLTGHDFDVDTAAVTNGDTTHLPTCDGVYDFVIGLGYLTAEADTLATVCGRGASYSGTITVDKIDTPDIYNAGNINIDAYNAAAGTTVYVKNSHASYLADLNVEGDLYVTDVHLQDYYLTGKIYFANNETIDNDVDDYIEFQGGAGTDDTDLRIDLDGTYPILESPTDTTIGIAELLIVTGAVTAPNYISNVAIGTQPYACTSTTVNTNLNADLLDGQHGSYYEPAISAGTTAQFYRGDKTWSSTLVGTLTADGLTMGANELITLGAQTLKHDATDFVFDDSVKTGGTGQSTIASGLVVNDAGGLTANDDFRVESDTETNMINVDADVDKVYLGGLTNSVEIAKGGSPVYNGTARPVRSFYIDAAGMWPTLTSGCASLAQAETTTNKINYYHLAFDGASDERAEFKTPLPKSWNGGTVTAIIEYEPTGTTGGTGIVWTISAVLVGDNATMDAALGSAVSITDTIQTANYKHITAESGAITIAGTLSGEKSIHWRITRDADVAGDTNTNDARLLGAIIKYTATKESDA